MYGCECICRTLFKILLNHSSLLDILFLTIVALVLFCAFVQLSFTCAPEKRGLKNSINEPQKISVKNVDFDATETLKKALTPVKTKPRADKVNKTSKLVEKLTKLPVTDSSEIKTSESEPDVTQLQHLIFVSQGKHFSQSSERLCNLYFICRVFWSDAMLQSNVCWDTYDPFFNWQKASVLCSKLRHTKKIVLWKVTNN